MTSSKKGIRAPRTAAGRSGGKRVVSSYLVSNRRWWDRIARSYERQHAKLLHRNRAEGWGLWHVPEARLKLLADVPKGRELELGCGAAEWSISRARRRRYIVGMDFSTTRLAQASERVSAARCRVRLMRANAEELPIRNSSFALVFCDWGAMTFADPRRTIPEVARVLEPGGVVVFSTASPFQLVSRNRRTDRLTRGLVHPYFGIHRIQFPNEVNFNLTYGEWVRLASQHDLVLERLVETRAPPAPKSSYVRPREQRWGRSFPLECIWRFRKRGEGLPASRTHRRSRVAS